MSKPLETVIVNTGDQHKVQRKIDKFFSELVEFLERNDGADSRFFEIKSGNIAYGGRQVTDDRVTCLFYRDTVMACVTETRTEFNYVSYSFFRNINQTPPVRL
ncbi:MAG: hypothetical protein ABSG05_00165 [Candidatus Pacearchaeota archaeon]|jgi:hypothetical protein